MHRRLCIYTRVCVCVYRFRFHGTNMAAALSFFYLTFFHFFVARFFAKYCWLADWGFVDFDSVCAAFGAPKCVITPFSLLVRFSLHAHLSNYLFSIRFDRSGDRLARCTRVHWFETRLIGLPINLLTIPRALRVFL